MLLVHTGLLSTAPLGKRTWRRQRGLLLGPTAQDRGRSPRVAGSSPSSRPCLCHPPAPSSRATYRLFPRSVALPRQSLLLRPDAVWPLLPLCSCCSSPELPSLRSLPTPPSTPALKWPEGRAWCGPQILSGPWSWTPDFCTLGSSLMMTADSDSDSGGPEGFPAAAPW